jgi:hypothetical protein
VADPYGTYSFLVEHRSQCFNNQLSQHSNRSVTTVVRRVSYDLPAGLREHRTYTLILSFPDIGSYPDNGYTLCVRVATLETGAGIGIRSVQNSQHATAGFDATQTNTHDLLVFLPIDRFLTLDLRQNDSQRCL